VTIAIVLIYVTAFASLAMGIVVLLSRYDVPEDAVLFVSLLGAAVILLGLLMIALASGLSRGSRFARTLITVYLVISIGLHVTTIVSTDVWDWSAAIQAVIDALLIAVLWLPPGSRFYARRPAAASVPA
jgi:hypothetical protein